MTKQFCWWLQLLQTRRAMAFSGKGEVTGALLSKITSNLHPLVFYLIQCVQTEQESVDTSVCSLLESIGIA